MIETLNLSKIYPGGQGIEQVNLQVGPGEVFGILGPNGSGKSTLIQVLSTYLEPTSGSFEILGYKNKKDELKIKKSIGVLLETSSHFEELSGLENAVFLAKIYGVNDEKQIDSLFEEFLLAKEKNEPVKNYSLGMKRKLSLIEVFCHNPQVLLLDDPFSGLDYSSKFILYKKLKRLAKNGKTILIVTNDVLDAEAICEKVGFLFNGELGEVNTVKNFLSKLTRKEEISLFLKKPIELSSLKLISGVEEAFFEKDLVKILAQKGVLPEIVSRIVKGDGRILNIKIKQPNLGDVFLQKFGQKIK